MFLGEDGEHLTECRKVQFRHFLIEFLGKKVDLKCERLVCWGIQPSNRRIG